MIKVALVIASLFSFVTCPNYTDLTGTWSLKDQQSISGTLYKNGVPREMKISQADHSLTMEKTTEGGSGDVTISEKLDLGGKPVETITPSKRKKVVTLEMNKDKSYTETAKFYMAEDNTKLEYQVTDMLQISDDQKTLTIQRKNQNFSNGEVWESKAIYEKQ